MSTPEQDVDRLKNRYESIDARDLSFRTWTYTGRRVKLSGQVTTINHDADGAWLTLRMGSFPHWVTVVVRSTRNLPELQRDMPAAVYGLCAGTERVRYESPDIIGLTVRRPLIKADHVEWLKGIMVTDPLGLTSQTPLNG